MVSSLLGGWPFLPYGTGDAPGLFPFEALTVALWVGLAATSLVASRRVDFRRFEPIAVVRGMGVDLAVPASPWRAPRFLIDAARQLGIPPRDWPS